MKPTTMVLETTGKTSSSTQPWSPLPSQRSPAKKRFTSHHYAMYNMLYDYIIIKQ